MFRFLLIARWKPWVSICHLSAHESWMWTSWSLGQSLYFSLPWLLGSLFHLPILQRVVKLFAPPPMVSVYIESRNLRLWGNFFHMAPWFYRNLFLPPTDPFPLRRISPAVCSSWSSSSSWRQRQSHQAVGEAGGANQLSSKAFHAITKVVTTKNMLSRNIGKWRFLGPFVFSFDSPVGLWLPRWISVFRIFHGAFENHQFWWSSEGSNPTMKHITTRLLVAPAISVPSKKSFEAKLGVLANCSTATLAVGFF